jgi:hypothetical protein
MRFEPRGQRFYTTGAFKQFKNQRALEAALRAAGAETTASVNLSTTAVITGLGWNTKVDEARARKLVVLTEAQAKLMLEQGFIELEEAAPAPELPRDANIGELRSVLAQPPSSSVWDQIVEHVDRCPPEQLDELVDYVDAQLSRWELDVTAKWTPMSDDVRGKHEWIAAQPRGELRCAPFHWITDLLQGARSAKYRLIRAIVLEDLRVKNADVIKLLGSEDLVNLRYLDMGFRNKYSPNIWKTLRAAPATRALEHLRVTSLKDDHAKTFEGPHHLDRLTALTIHYNSALSDPGAVVQLLSSSWMQQLTRLTIQDNREPLELLTANPALLPALETINIDGGSFIAHITSYLPDPLRAAHTLAFTCDIYRPNEQDMADLVVEAPAGFKRLDLSGLTVYEEDPRRMGGDDSRAYIGGLLLRQLPGSPLARSFPAIKLGRWWTQGLADALAKHGCEAVA